MSSNGAGANRTVAVGQKARAEAVRLYQTTDLSAEEIGRRYGVSRQTVHRWIQGAGVPQRGPMGPRNRQEEEEEPAAPLLGRLMDDLDSTRRELAELRGRSEAYWSASNMLIEALTAAVHQLVGGQEAHAQAVSSYQDWMREQMGALSQRLPK